MLSYPAAWSSSSASSFFARRLAPVRKRSDGVLLLKYRGRRPGRSLENTPSSSSSSSSSFKVVVTVQSSGRCRRRREKNASLSCRDGSSRRLRRQGLRRLPRRLVRLSFVSSLLSLDESVDEKTNDALKRRCADGVRSIERHSPMFAKAFGEEVTTTTTTTTTRCFESLSSYNTRKISFGKSSIPVTGKTSRRSGEKAKA